MKLRWDSPKPSFQNVIPNGEGWYQFFDSKWRKIDNSEPNAKWLSRNQLLLFAKQAVEILRKK